MALGRRMVGSDVFSIERYLSRSAKRHMNHAFGIHNASWYFQPGFVHSRWYQSFRENEPVPKSTFAALECHEL